MGDAEAVLRVERGQVSEEELAALTAVLLALRAGGSEEPEEPLEVGSPWWNVPEGYAAPGSWR
ncbi:acyl-CoA carboxylase epsilon subunit [Streptomyces sp. NPDC053750]|uniref:acyl-CoA carboxylase epsilon subunit n=1 Tax=Streptomyces sp. NPDC053750 TaxID=3365714 RepID=UPI0037D30EF5